MYKNSKIYIAGHQGLVGSAILNNLKIKGYTQLITRTHEELDLIDSKQVAEFFEQEKPEYVFLAAARVGGITANNTYRGDFIYDNLMIQTNVIHCAYKNQVRKLLFMGSTCIYPKNSPQPIKEEYLLTGPLEYTNEPYAIAKIAGIKMCESYNLQYGTNFISVMPTNLYGPKDNFDLETSHVLPALIRKVYLGKALEENKWNIIRADLNRRPIEGVDGRSDEKAILAILEKYGIVLNHRFHVETLSFVTVEIWGSGKPLREFLWSEDMADACTFLMKHIQFADIVDQMLDPVHTKEVRNTHLNIGTGEDISIRDLAFLIRDVVGFGGEFFFNSQKADGTFKKLTDTSKLNKLGWKHQVELREGIEKMLKELVETDVFSLNRKEKILVKKADEYLG